MVAQRFVSHWTLITIVMSGAISASVAAQSTDQKQRPVPTPAAAPSEKESSKRESSKRESKNDSLLAGPKVEDAPAKNDRRPEMEARGQRNRGQGNRDQAAPMRWMTVLRELDLNDAQRTQVEGIIEEMKAARQKFEAENAAKREQLMARARQARESGAEAPADLRRQMQQLQEAAPKAEEYQQRVWKVLSSEQQATMRRKLDEMEKRQAEQRAKRQSAGAVAKDGDRARKRGSMDEMDRPRKRPVRSRPAPPSTTKDRPNIPDSPSTTTSDKPSTDTRPERDPGNQRP